jgi:hypothetical protein
VRTKLESANLRRGNGFLRRINFAVISVAGLASSARAGSPEADAETAALAAAQPWLAKVDAGQYAESWDEAAQVFRSAVTKERWAEMASSVRKPLGKVSERKLSSKHYTESLPNAPPGKYVVIQFDTKFENKKATETIVPMLDKDGKWRVSGYFIK